ncbi:MAG: hypothetical protein FJZ58_00475 [Chlamydiae bacterium]|nr:hypothetical protein [Chlamydiota bacterium]
MLLSRVKKCISILLYALLFFAIERFCHKQTEGFLISKIRLAFPQEQHPLLLSSLTASQDWITKEILSQPLHYIGRGGQCYAFATQDERYVVKLLKYNNNYPKIWFSLFPFPFAMESYRQEKLMKKRQKLAEEYTSYQIALEQLPEETGIVYFHINQGTLKGATLHIEDKLGIHHFLSADSYQFYIQKKGTPFYPGLQTMIQERQFDQAKVALTEFVSYLVKRCKKNITDGDAGIWRNFAFQENGSPFQIDIGQFAYMPSSCSWKDHQQDLLLFTAGFRDWLDKNDPSLAEHLVQTIIDQTETLYP